MRGSDRLLWMTLSVAVLILGFKLLGFTLTEIGSHMLATDQHSTVLLLLPGDEGTSQVR